MPFTLVWLEESADTFHEIEAVARKSRKVKASKQEGLFKQVVKCVELLQANPRHPGLKTHEYNSIENPYDPDTKVFEAYVQNRTPGAFRVFWCYGPKKGEITIIAITPHP